MNTTLFAYGTLMCEEIMRAVTQEKSSGTPAILTGFRRRVIHGEHYPGIIADPAEEVHGIVYESVSPRAWERLDIFEGSLYERIRVPVRCATRELRADTYIVRKPYHDRLSERPWSYQHFISQGKQPFQAHYLGFDALNTPGGDPHPPS